MGQGQFAIYSYTVHSAPRVVTTTLYIKCKNIFTKMLMDANFTCSAREQTRKWRLKLTLTCKVADLEFDGFGKRYEDFMHQELCTLLYKRFVKELERLLTPVSR